MYECMYVYVSMYIHILMHMCIFVHADMGEFVCTHTHTYHIVPPTGSINMKLNHKLNYVAKLTYNANYNINDYNNYTKD